MIFQIKNLFNLSFLLVAFLSFTFTSCSTEEANGLVDVDNFTQKLENRSGSKKGRCFELVFPITKNIGGEELTFEDKETLREALKTYKEKAGNNAERSTYVFPITIENADGEQTVINSEEEYADIKESCEGSRGEKGDRSDRDKGNRGGQRCFDLVFPVTQNIGGEEFTFDDKETLRQAFRAYKEEAGDDAERPTFVYPVTVELSDGTQVTLEDADAMETLKEECGND